MGIMEAIQPLTGGGQYVFPSRRGDARPMSDNTIRTVLITLSYDSIIQTAHGFRTIASTLLNEQRWRPVQTLSSASLPTHHAMQLTTERNTWTSGGA